MIGSYGAGAYPWHTFYGSSDYDNGWGITSDGSGCIYVAGDGIATWPGSATPLNAHVGSNDIVVVKLVDNILRIYLPLIMR